MNDPLPEQGISNFHCLGNECPNHCCGAYGAISEKLTSLSSVGFTEIILTDEDVNKIRDADLDKYIIQGTDGIWRIKTYPDGTCYALKDGRCAVYAVRPSICIAYPLYLDLFAGLCYLNECPAFSGKAKISDYRSALHSLLDIYQYWIDHYKKELSRLETDQAIH